MNLRPEAIEIDYDSEARPNRPVELPPVRFISEAEARALYNNINRVLHDEVGIAKGELPGLDVVAPEDPGEAAEALDRVVTGVEPAMSDSEMEQVGRVIDFLNRLEAAGDAEVR